MISAAIAAFLGKTPAHPPDPARQPRRPGPSKGRVGIHASHALPVQSRSGATLVKLNITLDGKTYEVEVEASEPERHVPRLRSAHPRHPAGRFGPHQSCRRSGRR